MSLGFKNYMTQFRTSFAAIVLFALLENFYYNDDERERRVSEKTFFSSFKTTSEKENRNRSKIRFNRAIEPEKLLRRNVFSALSIV